VEGEERDEEEEEGDVGEGEVEEGEEGDGGGGCVWSVGFCGGVAFCVVGVGMLASEGQVFVRMSSEAKAGVRIPISVSV